MNKKLLAFRLTIIGFILLNFIISFRLETEVACLIMFFNLLLSISYLIAEIIAARD
jgi:hypothetical protein